MKISPSVVLPALAGAQNFVGQKYPSWCQDVADTTYVTECGGTGMDSDGLPAWCGPLEAKAKGCIAQCGGTFTSSCCDGMDAQTQQNVVGCNGENDGNAGGSTGGGGDGGMGGGGGGETSDAVVSQGRIIFGASLISALSIWPLL